MSALICGSLAFDTIMVFPDRFARHILPDQTHMLSVSFQIGEMRREFGGCAGNIAYNLKALGGEPVGTLFHATGRRRSTRLLWLAHATEGRGRVVLDDGAVRAVAERRASLLPAGVVGVEGVFEAGDAVDLVDGRGHAIARGLVNYSSAEVPGLLGKSTRDLATTLGPGYGSELVHRDQMALTAAAPEPPPG